MAGAKHGHDLLSPHLEYKPVPYRPPTTLKITESGTFRPGRPMRAVVTEYRALRVADRMLTKMSAPPPEHKQKPATSRQAAQQPSVPEGQPQKGDCSGPATAITIITPADL